MKKTIKKIAVVTGARSEYGLLKPIMKAIERSPDLKLYTVVTGSHLTKISGYSIKDITNDGFKIDAKVPMYPDKKLIDYQIPQHLSKGLFGLTTTLKKINPDMLVVLGDRGEALVAVIAATYLNIPIAHIHGGDQCAGADIDDNIRHAITKLSHLHFPVSPKSADRINALGEERWRTTTVGAPGLDAILHEKLPGRDEMARQFSFDPAKPIILLLQHAVSSETAASRAQMTETMRVIDELKHQTVVIYPNADPGNEGVIEVIEKYKDRPFLRLQKSLPRALFLGLMKTAEVMVGNSSSGIIEAPSFGLPVVNIGIRQTDRERGMNVLDVNHNGRGIKNAINRALTDKAWLRKVKQCKSPYGDGHAGERVAKVLSKTTIDNRLMRKKFVIKGK